MNDFQKEAFDKALIEPFVPRDPKHQEEFILNFAKMHGIKKFVIKGKREFEVLLSVSHYPELGPTHWWHISISLATKGAKKAYAKWNKKDHVIAKEISIESLEGVGVEEKGELIKREFSVFGPQRAMQYIRPLTQKEKNDLLLKAGK